MELEYSKLNKGKCTLEIGRMTPIMDMELIFMAMGKGSKET
jgi:hypothetical protein